jgi:hypothetical protein
MSMVDGFPYKEEVGGSNPSVPTINYLQGRDSCCLRSDRVSCGRARLGKQICLSCIFDLGLNAES